MKALILAGGRGKRLDNLVATKNKCMIEIKGKPVIEYSLDCAAGTDVDEIVIVVGYRADDIINAYGNRYGDKPVRYVIQWEQEGLVHAIECSKDALAGHDFMLLLGDEVLINPRHQAMLDEFRRVEPFALCGILHVADRDLIKRTYALIRDDSGKVYRLIEKPHSPPNNIMGTGDCVFKNEILNYIDKTPKHHVRNQKELPDLIQCTIDDGRLVKTFSVCDKYTNINTLDDIEMTMGFLG
ncbi:MAG: nucleotidyltransferase family protein [Thermodesulfobacteriota bacterium]